MYSIGLFEVHIAHRLANIAHSVAKHVHNAFIIVCGGPKIFFQKVFKMVLVSEIIFLYNSLLDNYNKICTIKYSQCVCGMWIYVYNNIYLNIIFFKNKF